MSTLSAGTIRVTAGSKRAQFTGITVGASTFKAGDMVVVNYDAARTMIVGAIVDTDELDFTLPWPGASGTGLAYTRIATGPGWGQTKALTEQVAEEIRLIGKGVIARANYATRAQLYLDLKHPAETLGKVYSDPTLARNGVYKKAGGVGEGTWGWIGPLPELDAAVTTLAAQHQAAIGDIIGVLQIINGEVL